MPTGHHLMNRLRIFGLLLLVPLTGCELGIGIGTGLHDDRDLDGRYEGTFTLEWDPFAGGFGREEDRGVIDLDRRHGRGFDGEWSWRLGGRWIDGDVEDGRADVFGDVAFELETDFGEDLLEAVTDCRFLSGDRRFHGSVSGRRLRVERSARLRCPDRFGPGFRDLFVRLSFSGWRDDRRF